MDCSFVFKTYEIRQLSILVNESE